MKTLLISIASLILWTEISAQDIYTSTIEQDTILINHNFYNIKGKCKRKLTIQISDSLPKGCIITVNPTKKWTYNPVNKFVISQEGIVLFDQFVGNRYCQNFGTLFGNKNPSNYQTVIEYSKMSILKADYSSIIKQKSVKIVYKLTN